MTPEELAQLDAWVQSAEAKEAFALMAKEKLDELDREFLDRSKEFNRMQEIDESQLRKTLRARLFEFQKKDIQKRRLQWVSLKPATTVQTQNSFDLPAIKLIPIVSLFALQKLILGQYRSRALCPFHEESSPSFTIFHKEEGDHYYCFGCGEHGDNIDFVMKINKVNFKEACAILKNNPQLVY